MRDLVLEIERVQTIRRRVPTRRGDCQDCRCQVDLVNIADLARVFDVSVADAVLQLRERSVHMQHIEGDAILVCSESLLDRPSTQATLLSKSLPPASTSLHSTGSSE